MPDPARIVRQYLIDAGVGTPDNGAWPVKVDSLPSLPDNIVLVQNTGGIDRGRTMLGERTVYPTVNVVVRSLNYQAGHGKGREVEAAFDRIANVSGIPKADVIVDGQTYTIKVARVTYPTTKISEDEQNKRKLFAVGARLTLDGLPYA